MVADIEEPLAAGESVSVWIQPRKELEEGTYDDTITYETEEGAEVSFEVKAVVEAEEEEPVLEPDDSEAPDDSENPETPAPIRRTKCRTWKVIYIHRSSGTFLC